MTEESLAAFIRDIGFPIAAFLLMYMLYAKSTKQSEKAITNEVNRYETLVNKFIDTVTEISENHDGALEKVTKALIEQGNKLDRHMDQKEAFIDLIKDERKRNQYG